MNARYFTEFLTIVGLLMVTTGGGLGWPLTVICCTILALACRQSSEALNTNPEGAQS